MRCAIACCSQLLGPGCWSPRFFPCSIWNNHFSFFQLAVSIPYPTVGCGSGYLVFRTTSEHTSPKTIPSLKSSMPPVSKQRSWSLAWSMMPSFHTCCAFCQNDFLSLQACLTTTCSSGLTLPLTFSFSKKRVGAPPLWPYLVSVHHVAW